MVSRGPTKKEIQKHVSKHVKMTPGESWCDHLHRYLIPLGKGPSVGRLNHEVPQPSRVRQSTGRSKMQAKKVETTCG